MSTRKPRSREVSVFDEESALEELLSDISHIYTGDRLDVTVNSDIRSQYDMNDSFSVSTNIRDEVGRPLNGPNKLRYIIDDLSHNIEHQKLTDFDKYLSFIKRQEDDTSKLIALLVSVLIEDQYVDTNRVKKHRGHRKSIAFKRALYMRGSIRPPLTDLHREAAIVEGFMQIATAGYIKDADALPERDQKLMIWVKETVEKARYENDQEKRLEYIEEITTYLIKAIDSNSLRAKKHIVQNPPSSYEFETLIDETSITTDVDDIETELREYIRKKIAQLLSKLGLSGNKDEEDDFELPDDAGKPSDEQGQEGQSTSQSDETGQSEESDVSERTEQGQTSEGGDSDRGAETLSDGFDDDLATSGLADGDDEGGGDSDKSDSEMGISEQDGGPEESSLGELLEQSDERDMFNVDSDEEDVFTPTEAEKERFERLRETIVREELGDVIERQDDRDSRMNNDSTSKQVLERVEKRGLADEVEDIFREIKTRESRVNAVKGNRMNQRAVTRNRSGDYTEQRLFYQTRTIELGNRTVGVSVDLSGSVDEVDAMVALGTLAKATDEIGDDFVATHFNSSDSQLITSPREDFSWRHFDSVNAGGNTPTAKGILDTRLLLQDITNRERVMFVITDGRPNEGLDSSEKSPVEDARTQVNEARRDNIKVIGLGLSGVDENNMEAIFGQDSYIMVNEQTLANDLLDAYRLQMGVVDNTDVNISV